MFLVCCLFKIPCNSIISYQYDCEQRLFHSIKRSLSSIFQNRPVGAPEFVNLGLTENCHSIPANSPVCTSFCQFMPLKTTSHEIASNTQNQAQPNRFLHKGRSERITISNMIKKNKIVNTLLLIMVEQGTRRIHKTNECISSLNFKSRLCDKCFALQKSP